MRRFSKLLPGSTWCLSSWFLSLTSPVTFFVFFFIFFYFTPPHTRPVNVFLCHSLYPRSNSAWYFDETIFRNWRFSHRKHLLRQHIFLFLNFDTFASRRLHFLNSLFFLLYGFRVYNSVWYSHSLSLSLFFGSAL